jgi:hypothetical protein
VRDVGMWRNGRRALATLVALAALGLALEVASLVATGSLVSVPRRWQSLWRDDSDANRQLAQLATDLRAGMTESEVLRRAEAASSLSVIRESNRLRVATPGRLLADNWVAWAYFDSDGQLLFLDFGTDDAAGQKEPGMPDDVCYGRREECDRVVHRQVK